MPSSPPPDTLATQHRRRLRERLLFAGPALALGLVLLMLWGFVAWFVLVYPKGLLEEQRRELAASTRAAAVQTEAVLRDAENSLRTVDLWLLTRGQREPLGDVSLAQLAETLRDTSRTLVDVMLIDAKGAVFRIPTSTGLAHAEVAGRDFFELLNTPATEGLVLGLPLRLRAGGPLQLPLAMRLSAPAGELVIVMALIDLQRLGQLHQNFARGPAGAVAMLRGDGIGLSRTPELAGFAGRDLFAPNPGRRADFADKQGFFTTTGAASDGMQRLGAYQTLEGFGVKLLVSQGESATLERHLQQRRLVLGMSSLISAAALAITFVLSRMQRAARLRDAALQATSNASPMGLFRCDLQGRVTYANETYLRLQGLSHDEAEWGWLRLIPEADRAYAKEQWLARMSSRSQAHIVRQMRRGDGELRLMSVRTAPLLVNGRVVGQAGTLEDITERAAQQKAEQTLTAIFDMTPDYVCQIDISGQLLYLNPAGRIRLGLAPDASLEGINYLHYYSAERIARFQNEILPAALRDGHWHGRSAVRDPCGVEIPVDTTVLVHRGSGEQIETISVILRDISAELESLHQRQRIEAMLLAVAHTAPVMISVLDTQQRYLFFNETFGKRFEVRREDWLGRHVRELLGEADYLRSQPLIAAALAGESQQIEKHYPAGEDGSPALIIEVQYKPLLPESGEIAGVICLARDITSLRHEEQRLRHASQTDPLTGLLNRSGFALGVDEELAQARQDNSLLGLLYLDLDRFKPVNDEHGHPAGDALLKAVAGRLRHALRPNDLVARLGGDEFAVLLPSLGHSGDAGAVAAKLVRALSAPFGIDELQLQIGVSVGFCVAPGGQADMEAMVAQADAKLYEAKRAGRGRYLGVVLQAL